VRETNQVHIAKIVRRSKGCSLSMHIPRNFL
jgi:hypothetical protein